MDQRLLQVAPGQPPLAADAQHVRQQPVIAGGNSLGPQPGELPAPLLEVPDRDQPQRGPPPPDRIKLLPFSTLDGTTSVNSRIVVPPLPSRRDRRRQQRRHLLGACQGP